MPRFTVRPDASRKILGVEVYYTQQGLVGKEHHHHRIAQFWHHGLCHKAEDGTWAAALPVFSSDKPLWVYANVTYALDAPVSGAGYYYGHYTAEKFNVSSLIQLIPSQQLQEAGVKPTLKPSSLIEDFTGDWRKEWFTHKVGEWSMRTHKVYHPLWAAPQGAALSLEVFSDKPNKLVVGIDDHAAEVDLGASDWQAITLRPSDFKDALEKPRRDWAGIKELRLLAGEHLRAGKRGEQTTRRVGGSWKGAPPKFRNLRWVK